MKNLLLLTAASASPKAAVKILKSRYISPLGKGKSVVTVSALVGLTVNVCLNSYASLPGLLLLMEA